MQQFPFYATVTFTRSGASYNCGGALLNTSFAITSASCVFNGATSVAAGLSITVTAGDHDNTICEGTEQSSLVCGLRFGRRAHFACFFLFCFCILNSMYIVQLVSHSYGSRKWALRWRLGAQTLMTQTRRLELANLTREHLEMTRALWLFLDAHSACHVVSKLNLFGL